MVGLLIVGTFLAVSGAYACTEFLLLRLDARRRVLVGEGSPLLLILGANFASFAILSASALAFVYASGTGRYLATTAICLFAQAVWLSQHLWIYFRDHVRLKYEL